ncbi:unnamed protein product [Brugia pahangi]|uniref:NADH:ubiquinone reductase (H(+)-translocating) n=1 Tax=Brugia pahangi TaxID=6280 RepID=A0A0N4T550_BRUPA|nr:unnamed protein product [Brugia pahangi]
MFILCPDVVVVVPLNLLIDYYYWEYFLIMKFLFYFFYFVLFLVISYNYNVNFISSEIFFNVPLRLKILLLFGTFNLIGVSYLVFYVSIISFSFGLKYYDYFSFVILCWFIISYICVSEVLCGLCLFFYSGSFLIFYIFYELIVLPVLFCLLGNGRQVEKVSACYYLSLVYFLHVWLPKVHVEAPTSTGMVLAGVILKLGGAGLYRIDKSLNFFGFELLIFFFG